MAGEYARLDGHIPALDGLRGVAIIIVMVLHFTFVQAATGAEHLYVGLIQGGWGGVDLFFVLSGFLITGILYDGRHSNSYFRSFYWRRAVRIFPLYYAFLFLLFVVIPWLKPGSHLSVNGTDGQAWAWLYLNNMLMAQEGWEGVSAHTTHLWSLAVEEQFYLVWPLIVWSATRNGLMRICIMLMAGAWLIRLALFHSTGLGTAGYVLFPARMDALAFGALLALLARNPDGIRNLRPLVPRAVAVGAALVAGTMAWSVYTRPPGSLLPMTALHTQLFAYPGVALLSGAALIAALCPSAYPRFSKMLCSDVLMRFGKYSYGLYVLHILLRDLLRDRVFMDGTPRILGSQIPSAIVIVFLAIAVSYGIAWVSWHTYEKHFLSLKRYLPYGHTRAPAGTDASPVQASFSS